MSESQTKDATASTAADEKNPTTSMPSTLARDEDDQASKLPSELSNNDQKPISKNAIKKRKRYEKLMDIKRRKKEQAKERKAAKAKLEGRDLDEERRLQAERQKSGVGRKKREERWKRRIEESADTSFKVCIDSGFEDLMTWKEKNSLASQIRYCYAVNKKSDNPVYISVSGLTESGVTCEQLAKVEGFPDQWNSAFSCSAEPLEKMHDKSKLVYLTSDSDHTLEHLDDSKVYVIGGIVDRNRLKRTTVEKANELGIATAKLPIEDHLKLCATKVLTVNHVFEILLKYRQHGSDWKKALLDVLPDRKDITEVDATEKHGGEENKNKEGLPE
jgi:tRNA (guanine9-N1)-methyltransferase